MIQGLKVVPCNILIVSYTWKTELVSQVCTCSYVKIHCENNLSRKNKTFYNWGLGELFSRLFLGILMQARFVWCRELPIRFWVFGNKIDAW
jgi:hypothetical protein